MHTRRRLNEHTLDENQHREIDFPPLLMREYLNGQEWNHGVKLGFTLSHSALAEAGACWCILIGGAVCVCVRVSRGLVMNTV